jgi:hypothetical protein
MTYWRIDKITGNQPTLSGGNTGWKVDIVDDDSHATATVHYEFPTVVGPDYDDGLKPLMIEGGYCPGAFGDCE